MESAVNLSIAEDATSLCGLKWRMNNLKEEKSFIT